MKLKDITWHNIDKYGYIEEKLNNKAAIYIYNSKDNKYSYIGSTVNLAARISSHRSRISNWDKYKNTNSSLLYKTIIKYDWTNFQLGVLEYIDLSHITNDKDKRQIILNKEQFYIDKINPSLNSCKIANSPLGIKRNLAFSIKMSKARRGKGKKWNINKNKIIKIVTETTKSKIALNNQGFNVKIFNKFNNLIHEFPSIRSTAKFFKVDPKTIHNIYRTGKSFDDYIYKFENKNNKILVYNIDHVLINTFYNAKIISLHYNIPSSTLSSYIKSNKLYKNKYYFYKSNSRFFSLNGRAYYW